MRTFINYACAALLIAAASLLTGCVGDVAPEQDRHVTHPDEPENRWFLRQADSVDTGYWPKWRNPCPGPACDPPPEFKPDWASDPPPDGDDDWRGWATGDRGVRPPERSGTNGASTR